MPIKKPISTAERRYHDYLRRKTLKVGAVYQARLAKARRKELRRVLDMARDLGDPSGLAPLLEAQLNESGYLSEWWTGLWTEVGVPAAKSTARSLREAKAAGEDEIWYRTLRTYATTRAGNEIVSVTGTWKDSLVNLLRKIMEEDLTVGVEKLTKQLYNGYVGGMEKWQCRRIAQTEAMIGMADAGAMAATTLDIPFTKQWCISGLGNTRPSHEAMDGVIVDQNEPFILPGGQMMYPHDTTYDPDPSEIINCACDVIRIPKGFAREEERPAEQPVQQEQPEMTEEEIREARIKGFMDEMPADWSDDFKKAKAENYLEIEEKLGVKKGKAMSDAGADEQSANPLYAPKWIPADKETATHRFKDGRLVKLNPEYNKAYDHNCATCTPAFMLRKWGFDVTAKGKFPGTLNETASEGKTFKMWKNADGTTAKPTLINEWMAKNKYDKMTPARYKKFYEESCKEQGYYAVSVGWKGKRASGHATILHRGKDGKLKYIEPQVYDKGRGVYRGIEEITNDGSPTNTYGRGVMRIDNKIFDTSWLGLFNVKKPK